MNDDLISRAAAIDILDAYQVMVENGEENPYAWARLRMSELPSAQPEIRTQMSSANCISRQAAIDLWEKYHHTIAVDAMQYDAELRQLPSAQPERKKGCKIVKGTGHYGYCACDQCGKPVHPEDRFCSKCGADFREDT